MTDNNKKILEEFREKFRNIRFDTTEGASLNLESFILEKLQEERERIIKEIERDGALAECLNENGMNKEMWIHLPEYYFRDKLKSEENHE